MIFFQLLSPNTEVGLQPTHLGEDMTQAIATLLIQDRLTSHDVFSWKELMVQKMLTLFCFGTIMHIGGDSIIPS
jgi:hypothetical protein